MDDNNFQNYNENRNSVDRSRPMGLLFKVQKVCPKKRSNLAVFDTFCQFTQNWSDNFSLYLVYSFFGMILINCQEMDFIELFERSFSRSERSGLAHFPIIIDIIQ